MYNYANPYLAYPYYYPNVSTVPVQYAPAHYNGNLQQWNNIRQFQYPEVDTQHLNVSVKRFQEIMEQADLLISKMAEDNEFAGELMRAAQRSDENRVHELIESTGVTIKTATTYTPTGIRILFDNSEVGGGCCDLLVALRW